MHAVSTKQIQDVLLFNDNDTNQSHRINKINGVRLNSSFGISRLISKAPLIFSNNLLVAWANDEIIKERIIIT